MKVSVNPKHVKVFFSKIFTAQIINMILEGTDVNGSCNQTANLQGLLLQVPGVETYSNGNETKIVDVADVGTVALQTLLSWCRKVADSDWDWVTVLESRQGRRKSEPNTSINWAGMLES